MRRKKVNHGEENQKGKRTRIIIKRMKTRRGEGK